MSSQECPLSGRELEILALVATGVTNAQIASVLDISPNTVKVHLRNIFAKLEVESRTEATTLAIRQGWIRVDAAPDTAPESGQVAGRAQYEEPQRRWEPLSLWRRAAFVALALVALAVGLWPRSGLSPARQGDAFADHATTMSGNAPRPGVSRWTEGAQMPTPRARLAFVALNGLLYAIGGDSAQGISDLVEVYDPAADLWSRGASKPTAVANIGAVAWQGKLYIPGGYTTTGAATAALEIYDPQADTWSRGPDLPEPLFGYALAVAGDTLLVFGGSDGSSYRDTTYSYDLVSERWSVGARAGTLRAFAAAATGDGGEVYLLGGWDGENELNLCQRYDPQAAAAGEQPWSVCAPMLSRRAGLAATLAAGQVYAIGGGWENPLYYNEKYDPRNDMWASVETPIVGQWRTLGAAALGQGEETVVYAVGGWNEGYLAVTERFRPLFYVNLPNIP
ncbi:MAG: hypothetical protein GXY76_14725 [Chloroflexi bacterium]|nr:hypothetical protein [Chloroflexota bacterium]